MRKEPSKPAAELVLAIVDICGRRVEPAPLLDPDFDDDPTVWGDPAANAALWLEERE